jgi:hypothetical protein
MFALTEKGFSDPVAFDVQALDYTFPGISSVATVLPADVKSGQYTLNAGGWVLKQNRGVAVYFALGPQGAKLSGLCTANVLFGGFTYVYPLMFADSAVFGLSQYSMEKLSNTYSIVRFVAPGPTVLIPPLEGYAVVQGMTVELFVAGSAGIEILPGAQC